jgi:nitrogen fixation protein NifU and related proteins
MYSNIVMDHFKNPRNVGEIENADGIGEVGNPVCGDMMNVFIKVENDKIADIKFKTFGCGAAIAVSSMLTELAKGKTLDEAMKITNQDVADALGGLPQNKLHCSNLGADALHAAIKNYLDRKSGKIPDLARDREEHVGGREAQACYCPYCSKQVEEESPFCIFCGSDIPHEHDH